MDQKNIKLIACDLDGTLLNSQKKLTEKTKELLSILHKRGIYFVPATGRAYHSIPNEITQLKEVDYIITSNGATIIKNKTQDMIQNNCIAKEIILKLIPLLNNASIMAEVFTQGNAYTEKKHIDNISHYTLTKSHMDYIKKTRIPIDDTKHFILQNKNAIENINIIFFDMDLRKKYNAILSKNNMISVTSSSAKNLEITSKTATKGNSLKLLCQILSITPKQVMAFGDNENDIDMLDFAGTAIAMQNSTQELKKHAHYITASCDKEGVAFILQNMFAI